MGLLDKLKPAPHIEPIKDQAVVKEQYQYWRVRILYSMFIGYAFYYFTRKSLSIAMPGLVADLHFDKSQLGILGSLFSVMYGISKFASGMVADRANPRYFMAIGLILTGIVNIFFGMSSSIFLFALFWALNGYFQGFGWPPCARFLTQWYSHSERGSWWSTWNVSHNVGAFIIPFIAGAGLHYFGWRFALYIPGVLCILGGLFLANRLRDTPQSLGLPPIEEFRNDYGGSKEKYEKEKNLSTKEVMVKYVLKNPYMWLLAIAYFFVYVVRTGINDWTPLYLTENRGYSAIGASSSFSLFEAGGFCGSLVAGWSSDRLFGAKRGPVNVIFAIAMLISISMFWFIPEGHPWLDCFAIFCIGFSIFGPQMLIGVLAAEFSHKQAAATSTGFVGFFAYIGASIAGYPLGKITDHYGWEGFFWSIVVCCGISILLLLPMWNLAQEKESQTVPVSVPNSEPETA